MYVLACLLLAQPRSQQAEKVCLTTSGWMAESGGLSRSEMIYQRSGGMNRTGPTVEPQETTSVLGGQGGIAL